MKNCVIGLDVGGTNIKIGIVDPTGTILAKTSFTTTTYTRNKKQLILALKHHILELVSSVRLTLKQIKGVGMGFPGLVDPDKGVVLSLTNIPAWNNVAIKRILEKQLGIPTFIENDVNLIALGEWLFGAGKGLKNFVCITLGTGVGGGLILNGEIYRGQSYMAGEVGHMMLNEKGPACNCGGAGCFERYVGNRYLMTKVRQAMKKKMALEDVYLLALRGNRNAIKFWRETAVHIGNALSSVVNLLNPSHIIIGGGVANSQKFIFPTIRQTIKARAMKGPARTVKIVRAKLGDDAGIKGAYALVSKQKRKG